MCASCPFGYHEVDGAEHYGAKSCCAYCKEEGMYETKDSGERIVHDSGMVRDVNKGKPRFELLIPKGIPFEEQYLTRIARLYSRGAEKYEPRNWEKANSEEELERAKESAFRHFMQWLAGETDEDHGAAVFFNINEVETIRYKQRLASIVTTEVASAAIDGFCTCFSARRAADCGIAHHRKEAVTR